MGQPRQPLTLIGPGPRHWPEIVIDLQVNSAGRALGAAPCLFLSTQAAGPATPPRHGFDSGPPFQPSAPQPSTWLPTVFLPSPRRPALLASSTPGAVSYLSPLPSTWARSLSSASCSRWSRSRLFAAVRVKRRRVFEGRAPAGAQLLSCSPAHHRQDLGPCPCADFGLSPGRLQRPAAGVPLGGAVRVSLSSTPRSSLAPTHARVMSFAAFPARTPLNRAPA